MAAEHVPLSPDHGGYTAVKTPQGHLQSQEVKVHVSSYGDANVNGSHGTMDTNGWQWRLRYGANLLQFLIFAGGVAYMYGQWAYYHPVYVSLTDTLKGWWNVPLKGKAPSSAHPEMVRPTYFILFTLVPVFVSVLAWEMLRNFNLRRITSPYIMKLMLILRRKPSLPGGRGVSKLSYGELFYVLVILIGGNIFVFGYRYDSRYQRAVVAAKAKNTTVTFDQKLGVAAQTFGFNAIYSVSLLFWPATRNSVWMEFLNISYANGIWYHRWLGVSAVVSATLHMSCYHSLWVRQGIWIKQAVPCFGCDIGVNNRRWQTTFGELAFLTFLIISVTSLPIVRRKFFNLFYYVHQLFFLTVVFIAIHYQATIWWMMPSIVVYFVNRALSAVNATAPVKVKEFTPISHDLVKIVLHVDAVDDAASYKVGQSLYVNVPAISKLEWHPFTIASSPQANPKTVTVMVKAVGDWTSDLVKHAHECKEKNVLPTVYVDGFYGSSLELYDEYSTVCLVAGGIGATPIFSILEDLTAKLAASQTIQQRVVFIYSFREIALLEEIYPVLKKLRQLDPEEQCFKTHLYLTRAPTDQDLNTTFRAKTAVNGPTRYDNVTTAATVITFHEPIRPWWLRSSAWIVAFVFAVLVNFMLEYGPGNGKINNQSAKLWPLQRFAEILVVYIAAMLVFCIAFGERIHRRRVTQQNQPKDSTTATEPTEMLTHRELMTLSCVVVGERPDVEMLIDSTYVFHSTSVATTFGKPVIGTFVSGPESMKRAVDHAVARIGVSHFDIHAEEFQL